MKKAYVVCLFLFVYAGYIKAQTNNGLVLINGEANMEISPEMSLSEARLLVMEMAKENAMEKAFGKNMNIIVGTETEVINGKTEKDNYRKYSHSLVEGEWMRTTNTVFRVYYPTVENKETRIYCTINGEARKLTSPPITLKYDLIGYNSKADSFKVSHFVEGQNIYLLFKAPVNGYLSVFLIDTDTAYCLFPYKNQYYPYCLMENNKEYVLFNPKYDYFKDKNKDYIDEYKTYISNPESNVQIDRICLIFSQKTLYKPMLDKRNNLSKDLQNKGYSQPSKLSLVEFEKWLFGNRIEGSDLQVRNLTIKIKKDK